MNWIGIPLTLLAGGMLALQIGVNSTLARNAGFALWASGASFIVGSLALMLCCIGLRLPWPGLEALRAAPAWSWTGGLLGAFYVTTLIIFAPRIGATLALALVIAGQLTGALLLDRFGLFGFTPQAITPGRLAGVALILTGALLIRRF
ncbi:DMT family transporter [Marinobacterium sedimentorum]|uniref:DMT family transporter n=1 Tax=Marinobacterium sedimentorum TaxID=2927804 RepID=UPI0020C6659C|nr:DMT family transporter [Marinobacterium sedimentorum]MCP8687689.1 DMT family transporter [Marinobacterium sedimentorum]